MPRNSNTEAVTTTMRAQLSQPIPTLSESNTKLEFDDNDDALGEAEFGSTIVRAQEPQPPGGTTKRKRPLKLTPSQRERKRAIDREAQRSIRIKTKNYIAHLENLVKVMEHSDTIGPDGETNRTRELMNQLKQSQDEVRMLRETMSSIQKQLGSVLGDSGASNIDSFLQRQSSDSASPASVPEPQNTVPVPSAIEIPSTFQPPPQPQRKQSNVSVPTMASQRAIPPGPMPARPERHWSNRSRPRPEGEDFFYAEYHLNRVYAAGPAAFGDTSNDEDIVVRAVIEGWAAVEDQYVLDLAWQVVREIDQVIWAECGIVERMAIIRFIRTKLLHQVNARAVAPFPPVPDFMVQEVQELERDTRRADIIDHFIWPGFRHCLTQSPQKYISNHFSDKFKYNIRFMWPFDISTAYTKDPVTQLYTSTPEFMSRQWNVGCWTMRRRFFEGSEELNSCIPRFEVPIQRALSLPTIEGTGMNSMRQNQMGLVEEQEVDEDGLSGLDGSTGIANATNMNVAGWQQSMPQYWDMSPMSVTGLDSSFGGLASHAGPRYSM